MALAALAVASLLMFLTVLIPIMALAFSTERPKIRPITYVE